MLIREINQTFITRNKIFKMLMKSFQSLRLYRFSELQKPTVPSTDVKQRLDHMLAQEEIEEETQKRKQQLELKHTKLQKLVDQQLKLPIKLYGTKDTYSSKYSYLPERIMAYYKIHPTMITEFLMKIYKASLYAMIDENESFMNEYWEHGLMAKVLANIKEAKKNYTLSIVQDKDFLKNMPESCQILDSVCLRGLSIDREANAPPQDYNRFDEAEDVGLMTFTPKYLTEDNEKFIDPTSNKKIYQGYENMVLRVLLRIRTPLRFQVKEIPISDEVYTWEHLVVVENQMIAPKHLESKYKLETLIEWLGKYRFGIWKVVDIDNFMKGNSPFRKYEVQDEELDPIFQGTIFDRSTHADIRKF